MYIDATDNLSANSSDGMNILNWKHLSVFQMMLEVFVSLPRLPSSPVPSMECIPFHSHKGHYCSSSSLNCIPLRISSVIALVPWLAFLYVAWSILNYLSILKEYITGYSIVGSQIFAFRVWDIPFQNFLTFMAVDAKTWEIQRFLPLYVIFFYSSHIDFSIVSLVCIFPPMICGICF